MDRRLILIGLSAGLAGSALAGQVLAQTAAPAEPMGPAEMDHAKRTAAVGTASLQMADLGLTKAHNAKLKEFAKFEHDEQTTIAGILKSMDPSMAPPVIDAKAAEAIQKLQGLQGAAFDKALVAGQIDGHRMLLAIQEDYLKAGKNPEHVIMAKLASGMIKEHLTLLDDLHKLVG